MLKQILNHCGIEEEIDVQKFSFPENFYPLPITKYIVFQTGSEKPSQVYNYYFEVVGKIAKLLQLNGVGIIQVGDTSDPLVPNALDLRGKLAVRQLAFVIKNSLQCITSHSFAAKLSRTYQVPLILIGSNFPMKKNLETFKDYTYIEPELHNKKWNYRDNDPGNTIQKIKPEVVSSAILKNLNIDFEAFPESVFVGKHYGMEVFDFVPDGQLPQHLLGKTINLRLDLYFNHAAIGQLSQVCRLNIATSDSFELNNVNIRNIVSVNYFCDTTIDYKFIKECKQKGINITVICTNNDLINDYRFNLLGITEVYRKKEDKSLDNLEKCAMMCRSSRLVFGRNKVYPTIYHYKKDHQVDLMKFDLPTINDDIKEFSDFFYIFKK